MDVRMDTARTVAAPKPAPRLQERRPGRARMLLDLAWLLGTLLRAAPAPSALWAGIALIQGLLTPAQLWLTKAVVDGLALQLGGRAADRTALWLGLLAGSVIAERALDGVLPWLQAAVREAAGARLRQATMEKAAGLDLAAFEHQPYYDHLGRVMADAEERGPRLAEHALRLLRTVPQFAGYAVALAALAPVLLLIVLAASVPVVGGWMLSGQIYWDVLREQTRDRRLGDYYARVLTDRPFAKEVRLYGLAGYLSDRWSALYWRTRDEARRRATRLAVRQRAPNLVMTGVVMLGVVWVATAGAARASAGTYAILFQSLLGILTTIFGLGEAIEALGEGSGYASEFRAFARLPAEDVGVPGTRTVRGGELVGATAPNGRPGGATNDAAPAGRRVSAPLRAFPRPLRAGVRFEDVWFTYPGSDRPALAGVTVEIAAGEIIALVGENGAGKTTLVKLLLGLYAPDRGRILFDGVDAREINPRALRAAASAAFQGFVRYGLSFGENVGLGQPERMGDRRRLEGAVARAGAHEVARALPEGYDTLLGPDVGGVDLSGGQWQRVALARGFFREAELLVLDEPTAALDPHAELAVFERFAELARGRTAVLVSHRLGMARLADRVIVLSGGCVAEAGTHEELLRAGGEYAAMFRAQARWYE
jgi:ATP-binding cassette subfamily B protein